MALGNEIILRPRFQVELDQNYNEVLKCFENSKHKQTDVVVKCLDEHIFIKIPKDKQHLWSPQLHLELLEINKQQCKLFGVFGPNPTMWTMFMFFHFLVVCMFIGFGIWAYTNWSLNTNYAIQLFMSLLMVVVWFGLYFIGRLGKESGKPQMHLLLAFMKRVLELK